MGAAPQVSTVVSRSKHVQWWNLRSKKERRNERLRLEQSRKERIERLGRIYAPQNLSNPGGARPETSSTLRRNLEIIYSRGRGTEQNSKTEATNQKKATNIQNQSTTKVLARGAPGMGKTTLAKKVVWDWGKNDFNKYTCVFLVHLNEILNPTDKYAVEKAILKNIGLEVSETRLREILEKFGHSCLLILDGLDEFVTDALEETEIMDIVQDRHLRKCSLLLTSRPHTTKCYQKFFDSVISVQGFTEESARKFASQILQDENNTPQNELVESVMKSNPANHSEERLYNCPILLSVLSYLVHRDNSVDLSRKDLEIAEIYFRMIECLFQSYVTKNKGRISDEKADFRKMLDSVGKIAWGILMTGKAVMKKEDLKCNLFAYGLLIGETDVDKLITMPGKDIVITFHHKTILEFFTAFYFLLMLSEGKSVKDLLQDNADNPTLNNPTFLVFCLWFVYSATGQKHLESCRSQFRGTDSLETDPTHTCEETLVSYIANCCNKVQLVTDDFPALSDLTGKWGKTFLKAIFSQCTQTEHLVLNVADVRVPSAAEIVLAETMRHGPLKSLSLTSSMFFGFSRTTESFASEDAADLSASEQEDFACSEGAEYSDDFTDASSEDTCASYAESVASSEDVTDSSFQDAIDLSISEDVFVCSFGETDSDSSKWLRKVKSLSTSYSRYPTVVRCSLKDSCEHWSVCERELQVCKLFALKTKQLLNFPLAQNL